MNEEANTIRAAFVSAMTTKKKFFVRLKIDLIMLLVPRASTYSGHPSEFDL